MTKRIPSYIRYITSNIALLFLYAILHRVVFYVFFSQLEKANENDVFKSFLLGIRFDLKIAVLMVFPIAILIFIVNTKFFNGRFYKKLNAFYFGAIYLITTLFYLVDYGYYDYLNTRLDASSLRFLEDLKISSQMLIESYPIFKGLLFLVVLMFGVYVLSSSVYSKYAKQNKLISKKTKAFFIVVPFLLMSFGVYNSFTHYPLRWSQAFFSKNNSVNQFALNPILYFFDSFSFRSSGYDLELTKEYYPSIASYLHLSKDSLFFERSYDFNDSYKQKPNVVIVMMESVGAASMSFYGNPIKTTPILDSMADNSVHFTNFFVHKAGTAASVFESITGLPDVDNIKTASRNPRIINQRVIFDQFDDYEKLYFLGGSANWANIRGVFQSNIKNLSIFEEGSYDIEKRADVWGIDDYELFKESNKELEKRSKANKPFVAYIQTSSNHKPFTFPEQKDHFYALKENDFSKDLLKKSGFKSVGQLNALRYLDFNIGVFMERAKKSGYYDNTVFLFFGDHNTSMNEFDFMNRKEHSLGLSVHHVPFFIHAPNYLQPRVDDRFSHLIDLFPTIAGFAKINHTNYTLGTNLLDSTACKEPVAFLYKSIIGEPVIELLRGDFVFSRTLQTHKTSMYLLDSDKLIDVQAFYPTEAKKMDSLLQAFYHSTNYLYYNNKKE